MLITCPYCGPRDVSEFTYQGDGNRVRPIRCRRYRGLEQYIYDRVNIAGDQNEIWQHSGGCRSHLVIVRNADTQGLQCSHGAGEKPTSAIRQELSTTQTALAEQALETAKAASKPKARMATKAAAAQKASPKSSAKPRVPNESAPYCFRRAYRPQQDYPLQLRRPSV
jgi:sarcosine oxidase subunit delta